MAHVIKELNGVEYLYNWNLFNSKETLKLQREKAYKAFLEDYKANREAYILGALPRTIFDDDQFDIVLSSHFLFVYEHLFDYKFHLNAIREMLRICISEIRIFPLINLKGEASKFLNRISKDKELIYSKISIEKINYEFAIGGNEMMRIIK
ncbi:MAG: hypothetical protein ACFFAS_01065 [Promethearchaeota archaeon]